MPEDSSDQTLLDAYEAKDTALITNTLKTTLNSGIKPEIIAENLIRKILDNPKPSLMPLLAKLPEVKNPFPEAKLLLAFFQEDMLSLPKAPLLAKKTTPAPDHATIKQESDHATAPDHAATKQEPIKKAPAPKDEPQPETPAKPTSSEFNWGDYLSNIEQVNLGISSTLKKCDYHFDGSILQIITERKIHKTILNSANNLKVLQRFIPEGIGLEIGDATELTKSSKEFSKISDIMGNVTEVKSDGVPF